MKKGSWTKDLRGTDAPKQYRQGWVEFYKLKLKVDERVLIPRPETELLVDEVINFVNRQSDIDNRYTIIDLGTGSGCIAISLAKNLPKARIFATDISDEALEVAKANAKLNKVEKRIFFLKSDLLNEVTGSPDVIVANLPYIPRGSIPSLNPSVKDFEPWLALDGGSDGFDLYRRLFQQISDRVYSSHPRGVIHSHRLRLIVCEIDESQDSFDHIAKNEAKKY